MSVTDSYLINNIIYAILENGNADANGTLLTDMFTTTEIVNALDRVQQKFLLDTGLVVTHTTIAGVAGTPKYLTPADSIRPRRLTWSQPA